MADADPRIGNWDAAALHAQHDEWQRIIDFVVEWLNLHGSPPTPDDVAALFKAGPTHRWH